MHVETYPAFLTPRDKKLSLSSFKEKSSEFGWLENENEREDKNIYEKKQSKCSVLLFYIWYIYITYFSERLSTVDAREFI